MKRRLFLLDNHNTWYDWRCTVTAKNVPPADVKTNYVEIAGAHGALDLSEALTGEPVYGTRKITASFMCSEGSHDDRCRLLRQIRTALHGRRVRIVEPDDPDHYLVGRVAVLEPVNGLAFLTFNIEATCDPWRYAINETRRAVTVKSGSIDLVVRNEGDRTVCPVIEVTGSVSLTHQGVTTQLRTGGYQLTNLRLPHGPSVIRLAGSGSVVLTYREAVL